MTAETPDPMAAPEAPVSDELAIANAQARPEVTKRSSALSSAMAAFCITLVGFGLFTFLNGRRAHRPAPGSPEAATATFSASEPPVQLLQLTADRNTLPGPQFTTSNVSVYRPPNPAFTAPLATLTTGASPDQRLRDPALVVDLGGYAPAPAIPNPALAGSTNPAAKGASALGAGETDATATGGGAQISAEERFAERIGSQDAERVKATQMHRLDTLIPQGNVIPAVLETAMNSDLPGFTRAVVSRDVRSFDGANVLIPRGSRLIGQYKSGVALGQSRVFVIWTRVIRPDGVSVQIGSPVTDTLGRGGLEGKVNNHFFTRFGGSILLSVLNAGLQALANKASASQIFIGSPGDAANVAGLALQKDGGRSPTIQTPQGTPIQIFVARDLDFSGVGPVAP